MRRAIHILVCLLVAVVVSAGCVRQEYRDARGMVWNTTYSMVYESETDLTDSIVAELKRVESSVSAFAHGSVVSLINRNESFVVDDYFRDVYDTSVKVSKSTGGAFDPTLAPLINAYGFGYDDAAIPDSAELSEILGYVGIEKTAIRGGCLVKEDPRTEFNFSAIAKGFGCDRVAAMLVRNGVTNYMVEIGGEIRMAGKNPAGEDWRISIDKPIFSNDSEIHESQKIVPLTDCGMATSGNYRNFKEIGGERVVHTLDRFTGRPVVNDLLSVTVVVPAGRPGGSPCMLADAYATACMSLGSEKAKSLIEREGLAAMFVLADGTVWESAGFP